MGHGHAPVNRRFGSQFEERPRTISSASIKHQQRVKKGQQNKRQNDEESLAVRKVFSSRYVIFQVLWFSS